ncbi:hypothetical protein [Streptomyces sp. NPDC005955]|uniref:hypothetical protein n=1 Tax=Streptomyces sp. NPDC005955 TaxID=3364738 RepID=UPI003693364F
MSSNPVDPDGPGGVEGADAAGAPRPRGGARWGGLRRSRVTVAAVAAVVLVGGGGTYLAMAASGNGPAGRAAPPGKGGDTPPPLALDGQQGAGGDGPGIAPGEPDPGGPRYEARGKLPKGPARAAVYRPGSPVERSAVSGLAGALGVPGEPVLNGSTWRVGAADGSPSLQVARDDVGTWTFTRYAGGSDSCTSGTRCTPDEERRPARVPGGSRGTAPIGEAAAKAAAAPVLKALGQDAAKVDARQVLGSARVVNAAPVVAGSPTFGWSTGLHIGPGGEVTGGSGRLAELVEGDTYPTISAAKALGLLNGAGDGQPVGIGGCATAVPHEDRIAAPCGEGSAKAAPEKDPLWITGAEFGLAAQLSGGRSVLVPSWLFEVTPDGSGTPYTVTQPAVSPAHLTAPGGSPSPRPEAGEGTETSDVDVAWYSVRKVEGGTVDELVLHFVGGLCPTYAASAREQQGRVTVRVTQTTEPGRACAAVAVHEERTVRLDGPLGDREVVDTKGAPVPDRAPRGWPGTDRGGAR